MATIGPFDFHGGYFPGTSYMTVPQGMGYATEMRGCRFTSGYVTPRYGAPVVNDAQLGVGKSVIGLTTWKDATNSKEALVSVGNSKIYIGDLSSFVPLGISTITMTDRTGAVTINSSDSQRYQFAALNNILVGVGGSALGSVPFKVTAYNANAANLGGTPPNGDAVITVNNFMFIGRQLGAAGTWSRVSWSNVVDPETWTAGNFVDFNKSDGEQVMALGSIGTDLYIFKQSSIGRLSTYSQVISGSATIGPLETVIRGIGACGPLCVDNLPNGNLIFLGSDGHLYEFDGSTIVDRSRRPYPGPNVYDSNENFSLNGLVIGQLSALNIVKVWRGINEVWVGFDSNASGSSDVWNAFVYDFEQQIWQGHVPKIFPKSFATQQIFNQTAAVYESSWTLFHGNANGYIYAHGNVTKAFPQDENGNFDEMRVDTMIQVAKDFPEFVPRSVCFELTGPNSGAVQGTLYVDYDAQFNGGVSIGSVIMPAQKRVMINLPIRQESLANVMPTVIWLHWSFSTPTTGTLEPFRMGKFYLSDEVVR